MNVSSMMIETGAGPLPNGTQTVTLRVRCTRADAEWVAIRAIPEQYGFSCEWLRPSFFHAMDFAPVPNLEFDCTFAVVRGEIGDSIGVSNIAVATEPSEPGQVERETEAAMRHILGVSRAGG